MGLNSFDGGAYFERESDDSDMPESLQPFFDALDDQFYGDDADACPEGPLIEHLEELAEKLTMLDTKGSLTHEEREAIVDELADILADTMAMKISFHHSGDAVGIVSELLDRFAPPVKIDTVANAIYNYKITIQQSGDFNPIVN
jgi:hypothetical protein